MSSRPDNGASCQATGCSLAPRLLLASAGSADLREQDLARLQGLAQWAYAYGDQRGFWTHNALTNNLSAISNQGDLSYEDSFVFSNGKARKVLVCGESACFMLQLILLKRGRGEYGSDLRAQMAHAYGLQNNGPLGFHVWIEISDPSGGIHLKIDLWGRGTNSADTLFPAGQPLGLNRSEVNNVFELSDRYPFTVGAAPEEPQQEPRYYYGP